MMTFLLIFIFILNIVSIALVYHCLQGIENKEKMIFIVVGMAIIYILTSIVYWISTIGIEMGEVSEIGKDLITFLFVPINSLVILPLLAKSYIKLKFGSLDKRVFFNRGIVLATILLILLIIECIYFKNIQVQVVDFVKRNMQIQQNKEINNNNLNNLENENTLNIINELEANIVDNQVNNLTNEINKEI